MSDSRFHPDYGTPAVAVEKENPIEGGTLYGIHYLDPFPHGEHAVPYIEYYKSKKERDFMLRVYLDERAEEWEEDSQ